MSSSALMYSCPSYGCPTHKRPNQSLPYYFQYNSGSHPIFVSNAGYISLLSVPINLFLLGLFLVMGKSQLLQFSIRQWKLWLFSLFRRHFFRFHQNLPIFSNAFGFHTFSRRYAITIPLYISSCKQLSSISAAFINRKTYRKNVL